ncbi:hypothetical protein LCGC14_2575280 [marine sediment metagenome]|uniref:Uncharacterized protein n=1 Tax=marine sediment metagenome TaxID=412755 RepID=A0A0F9AG34_9ZZZZ
MTTENPYNGQMQLIGYETVLSMQLRVYANAVWDEGHTAAKAEQARIVKGLVEVCKSAESLLERMHMQADSPIMNELKQAIAKATQ